MAIALMILQMLFTLTAGIYFYRMLKGQDHAERIGTSKGDMDHITALRQISLSPPLSEKARPQTLEDIVGQQDGIRALKAILCGPNPQHVIVYGPPGIGKTAAARLVLEAAKRSPGTPFAPDAPFVEMDATCVRFDERAIADPLLGSVHDPIYQGAGPLGINGVPQPKEGAVTRAHGGILFLDEIGELNPIQMNKLLKVLEDRKVRLESAYYDPQDRHTPRWIHDVFRNGLPADFRLVGATTKPPEELPPALRSRCMEVFFRALQPPEISQIALSAAIRTGYTLNEKQADLIGRYARNGREAVNIMQMAAGLARQEKRSCITCDDVEWVAACCHYVPRPLPGGLRPPFPGRVNGLAVHDGLQGTVMELEAAAWPAISEKGTLTVTGIVESEELSRHNGHTLRRSSTANASAQNALTCLRLMDGSLNGYHFHLNFPGGMPIDGPSAGIAMAIALYSAARNIPVRGDLAVTGEISLQGRVLPVGGVTEKIDAAMRAGLHMVIIPKENDAPRYHELPIEVIALDSLDQAISIALNSQPGVHTVQTDTTTLAAEGSIKITP